MSGISAPSPQLGANGATYRVQMAIPFLVCIGMVHSILTGVEPFYAGPVCGILDFALCRESLSVQCAYDDLHAFESRGEILYTGLQWVKSVDHQSLSLFRSDTDIFGLGLGRWAVNLNNLVVCLRQQRP